MIVRGRSYIKGVQDFIGLRLISILSPRALPKSTEARSHPLRTLGGITLTHTYIQSWRSFLDNLSLASWNIDCLFDFSTPIVATG